MPAYPVRRPSFPSLSCWTPTGVWQNSFWKAIGWVDRLTFRDFGPNGGNCVGVASGTRSRVGLKPWPIGGAYDLLEPFLDRIGAHTAVGIRKCWATHRSLSHPNIHERSRLQVTQARQGLRIIKMGLLDHHGNASCVGDVPQRIGIQQNDISGSSSLDAAH